MHERAKTEKKGAEVTTKIKEVKFIIPHYWQRDTEISPLPDQAIRGYVFLAQA
jgi:hypothetical protein